MEGLLSTGPTLSSCRTAPATPPGLFISDEPGPSGLVLLLLFRLLGLEEDEVAVRELCFIA